MRYFCETRISYYFVISIFSSFFFFFYIVVKIILHSSFLFIYFYLFFIHPNKSERYFLVCFFSSLFLFRKIIFPLYLFLLLFNQNLKRNGKKIRIKKKSFIELKRIFIHLLSVVLFKKS